MVLYPRQVRGPWILLTVPVLLVSACGSDTGGSSGTVYSTPGTAISVASGKEFTIELEATPSTGYSWQLAQPPGDKVVLLDSDFEQGGSQPGASGMQRFVFKAQSAGTTTLSFGYVRPWEQGVAPAKTADFPVTVT